MKKNLRVREETCTSSSIFHNESRDHTPSLMQEKTQMQSIRARESTRTFEWTDEKHSNYLKSIEASFVNQLYDSKHMLPSSSRKGTSRDPATTSTQFKALRGGCWKRINFDRENPQMSRVNELHDLTANPWIQHYRSSSKQASHLESVTSTSEANDLGQRKGFSSGQLRLRESHHDIMLCSDDTEMSDQNFVDEEVESKEENNRSNVKRLKSLIVDAKSNDRIIQISKSSTIEDVTKNCVSAA